jgi:hypothetical protein
MLKVGNARASLPQIRKLRSTGRHSGNEGSLPFVSVSSDTLRFIPNKTPPSPGKAFE